MSKPKDWTKEQPHDADSGRFVKRTEADRNPKQVVWVKEKKGK
jgi:hypothetical protein